jgi:uncharacterized membrane protein YccC
MIFMTGAIIVGVVLGALIVQFVPRNVLEWSVLGLGAAALFFMIPGLVAILIPGDTMFSPAISIPLVVVCLVCGIGAVLKSYRTWRVWLGVVAVLLVGILPVSEQTSAWVEAISSSAFSGV